MLPSGVTPGTSFTPTVQNGSDGHSGMSSVALAPASSSGTASIRQPENVLQTAVAGTSMTSRSSISIEVSSSCSPVIPTRGLKKKGVTFDLDVRLSNEQSALPYFSEVTPSTRPQEVSKEWWRQFMRARKLHDEGHSLTDLEAQSTYRRLVNWVVGDSDLSPFPSDVANRYSEEKLREAKSMTQFWISDSLDSWLDPLWLREPEKELLGKLERLKEQLRAAGKETLTPDELYYTEPEIYEALLLNKVLLKILHQHNRYSTEQVLKIITYLFEHCHEVGINMTALPNPQEFYRINEHPPRTDLSKQLWEYRFGCLLVMIRKGIHLDRPCIDELNCLAKQFEHQNIGLDDIIQYCSKIDPQGRWDRNALIRSGIISAHFYRVASSSVASPIEGKLLKQRIGKIMRIADRSPELIKESQYAELKFGLQYYQSQGLETEKILEALSKAHPASVAGAMISKFEVGETTPEKELECLAYDQKVQRLLLYCRCFKDALPTENQRELQRVCWNFLRGGAASGTKQTALCNYLNRLDPAGNWAINASDAKQVLMVDAGLWLGCKPAS